MATSGELGPIIFARSLVYLCSDRDTGVGKGARHRIDSRFGEKCEENIIFIELNASLLQNTATDVMPAFEVPPVESMALLF